MSDTRKQDTPTTAERLSSFLGNHRKFLLILGTVLVVGIFAAVVIFQVVDNRIEQAAREAELLVQDWERWTATAKEGEDSTSDLQDLESSIRTRAEGILADYSRSYGALRALQVLTQLEWKLDNYAAARDRSLEITERFPRSHLVGTALANAAAASEELGDVDEARSFLDRIVAGEGAPTAEKARALFNLGRLSELEEQPSRALQYYNRLVDDHPDSNWTNLGRNRIIWLTSQGVRADT